VDDERVGVGIRQGAAKHAALGAGPARDVGQPPRAPEVIHVNAYCRMPGIDATSLDSRGVRAARRRRRRRRVGLPVDELLQLLAWLEVRDLFRRDVHLVAGLRVAPLAGLPAPQPEAAEPAQLDLLAAVERVDDALEDRVDDDLRMLFREVRNP